MKNRKVATIVYKVETTGSCPGYRTRKIETNPVNNYLGDARKRDGRGARKGIVYDRNNWQVFVKVYTWGLAQLKKNPGI